MGHPDTTKPKPSFAAYGFEENGVLYWWGSWFAHVLGYQSLKPLQPTLFKAMQVCAILDISVTDNFPEARRLDQYGRTRRDYKLTHFACYLVAMAADVHKPNVLRAQTYFAQEAGRMYLVLEGSKDIERLLIREEVREGHHHLTDAAARAGIKDFRSFMNEGYTGLYDQPIRQIKEEKGISGDDNLYEYMGRAELAANLLRITMTEERLRSSNTDSSYEAAAIHRRLGEDIRRLVKDQTGQYPEHLLLERHLHDVSGELKRAARLLNQQQEKPQMAY